MRSMKEDMKIVENDEKANIYKSLKFERVSNLSLFLVKDNFKNWWSDYGIHREYLHYKIGSLNVAE